MLILIILTNTSCKPALLKNEWKPFLVPQKNFNIPTLIIFFAYINQ